MMFLTGAQGGPSSRPTSPSPWPTSRPGWAGAAGSGALQTGQRIGSAIGAAVLMTVYQTTLHAGAGMALRVTLSTAPGHPRRGPGQCRFARCGTTTEY